MLADGRQVAHGGDQPLRRVTRMRAGKPDAAHARHLVDRFEQAGEVAGRIVRRLVVIDDLPEQLDLHPAAVHGVAHVGQDFRLRAHPFVAARVGDDAEGAVVVAALR